MFIIQVIFYCFTHLIITYYLSFLIWAVGWPDCSCFHHFSDRWGAHIYKLIIWSCVDFVGWTFSMRLVLLSVCGRYTYMFEHMHTIRTLQQLQLSKEIINCCFECRNELEGFFLEQVVVFDNIGSSVDCSDPTMEDGSHDDESGAAFLFRILKYMETPQYLRKSLFPMHNNLRYVVRIAVWNYDGMWTLKSLIGLAIKKTSPISFLVICSLVHILVLS